MKSYGISPVLPRILDSGTDHPQQLSIHAQEALAKAVIPAMREVGTKVDLGAYTWREPGNIPKNVQVHDVRAEKKKEMESLRRWHEIPDQDLTQEQIREMKALDMRGVLNPEEEIASIEWDPNNLPKNVHFGRVIEGPGEFYSARIPKKQRTASIVDDIFRKDPKALRKLEAAKEVITTRIKKTSFRKPRRLNSVPERTSHE